MSVNLANELELNLIRNYLNIICDARNILHYVGIVNRLEGTQLGADDFAPANCCELVSGDRRNAETPLNRFLPS